MDEPNELSETARWRARLETTVAELVAAALHRNPLGEKAFVELIRRHEPAALAVALALCGRGESAADVVQESFLKAWQNLEKLRQPHRFGPWVLSIVRNQAADQRRRTASRGGTNHLRPSIDLVDSRAVSPIEALEQRQNKDRLRLALAELDETSAQIITLRYFQNLSSREIGQLLDLTPDAVDMRLWRAKEFLRAKLIGNVVQKNER
jgi:RNA polymerase sigma-70 factor (ECF subfamily)